MLCGAAACVSLAGVREDYGPARGPSGHGRREGRAQEGGLICAGAQSHGDYFTLVIGIGEVRGDECGRPYYNITRFMGLLLAGEKTIPGLVPFFIARLCFVLCSGGGPVAVLVLVCRGILLTTKPRFHWCLLLVIVVL